MYQCKECKCWSTTDEWNEQLDKSSKYRRTTEIEEAHANDMTLCTFECPKCEAGQDYRFIKSMPYHELAKAFSRVLAGNTNMREQNDKMKESLNGMMNDLCEAHEERDNLKKLFDAEDKYRNELSEQVIALEGSVHKASGAYARAMQDNRKLEEAARLLDEKADDLENKLFEKRVALDYSEQKVKDLTEANGSLRAKLQGYEKAYDEVWDKCVSHRLSLQRAHEIIGNLLKEEE